MTIVAMPWSIGGGEMVDGDVGLQLEWGREGRRPVKKVRSCCFASLIWSGDLFVEGDGRILGQGQADTDLEGLEDAGDHRTRDMGNGAE